MKKKKWFVIALAMVCCGLMAFSSFATTSNLADAKKKKTAIEQEMKRAKETLAKLETLKGDAVAYVKKLDASLETLSEELSQLSTDIENKEEQIAIATTELVITPTKFQISKQKNTNKMALIKKDVFNARSLF